MCFCNFKIGPCSINFNKCYEKKYNFIGLSRFINWSLLHIGCNSGAAEGAVSPHCHREGLPDQTTAENGESQTPASNRSSENAQYSVHIHANKGLIVWSSFYMSFFRTRKSLFVHSALMLLKEMTNCQSKISLCKSVSELRSHICDGKIRTMYTASGLALNIFCVSFPVTCSLVRHSWYLLHNDTRGAFVSAATRPRSTQWEKTQRDGNNQHILASSSLVYLHFVF